MPDGKFKLFKHQKKKKNTMKVGEIRFRSCQFLCGPKLNASVFQL